MIGPQAKAFLDGEGQAWLDRNKHKLPVKDDPVLTAIKKVNLNIKRVLEIGCADGWRLKELEKIYDCICYGIDPSVIDPTYIKDWPILFRGEASDLSQFDQLLLCRFDTIIYGFCLYLCDPEDYFKIAAESDRMLEDGGYIIIYDFYSNVPHSRPYSHKEGVFSYKWDFARLWLAHPHYQLVSRTIRNDDSGTAVTILKKNLRHSFPVMDE